MKTDKEIFNKFPELCTHGLNTNKDSKKPIAWYGIECDYGWYDIINDTLHLINYHCKYNNILNCIHIVQIKEKYGGLRIYVEIDKLIGVRDHTFISNIIKKAEAESFEICEVCGGHGKLRKKDWFKTICWKCKLKRWLYGIFKIKK